MSTHSIYELAKETRVLEAIIEVTMTRWIPTVERKQYEIQCKLSVELSPALAVGFKTFHHLILITTHSFLLNII